MSWRGVSLFRRLFCALGFAWLVPVKTTPRFLAQWHRVWCLFAGCVFCATLIGCAVVPVTGRQQLNLITAPEELELGLKSFDSIKKEQKISQDAQAAAMVRRVGKKIAAVAPLPGAQWEFVLFESREANAFCLPGGKVGVYTGILPITRDEAGLATVLAHEIAHAVARHGAERMSEAMLINLGGAFLDSALNRTGESRDWAPLATTAYGLGSKLGRALPHSRRQELEADQIGLLYMARAGNDPTAALDFWRRFAEHNSDVGSATPWFMRTHPLDAERMAQIRQWMPRAQAEYERYRGAKQTNPVH